MVVEKRFTANIGKIVVAIIDTEFNLKTLGKENNQYILIAANKNYPILKPAEGFEIFGVVVSQFRKYG